MNFWTNRKILDPESEKRRDELLTGDMRTLPFHFLYFPSLAVLSDPVKRLKDKWQLSGHRKMNKYSFAHSIYLLSTFAVLGICPKPLEHDSFQTK